MVENKKKSRAGQLLLHIYFLLCCLFFIIPLVLVITSSFTDEAQIRLHGYSLFPRVWSLEAYSSIFKAPQRILDAYAVTAFTAVVGTFFSTLVMALIAYPLSRRDFAYRNGITVFVFITMLFSGGLIPSYIVNTQLLGLGNSLWIYLLPSLANAWHIIIIRTFFQSIPVSLIESAKMDGAKELRLLFSVILPLSTPVLATISLLCLLAKWNEWMVTLIYITDNRLYTLQFMLNRILLEAEFVKNFILSVPGASKMIDAKKVPTLSMRYAMTLLAAGPMLVIFPFFQKYFTKGLTIGAVKG